MPTNTSSSTTPARTSALHSVPSDHPPELVAVEDDAYVFVAAIEDPTLDGRSNWLSQMYHVTPQTDANDEVHVDVTERYHIDSEEGAPTIGFEDQYTVTLALETTSAHPQVSTLRRALERWYREAYVDGQSADSGDGEAVPRDGECRNSSVNRSR